MKKKIDEHINLILIFAKGNGKYWLSFYFIDFKKIKTLKKMRLLYIKIFRLRILLHKKDHFHN